MTVNPKTVVISILVKMKTTGAFAQGQNLLNKYNITKKGKITKWYCDFITKSFLCMGMEGGYYLSPPSSSSPPPPDLRSSFLIADFLLLKFNFPKL